MSRSTTMLLVTLAAALVAVGGTTSTAQSAPSTSPIPVYMTNPLTRIYRGHDGGVLYLRQVGTKVYGFGEHPGIKYAYVLTGSVSGDRISGSWWDVPKGARRDTNRGTLSLRFSQAGARIDRSGGADLGPDSFTAIDPGQVPWPNMQSAGFQAGSTTDLDGVFVGDDGSRHYAREVDGDAVWVAERAAQPGERPGWVTVFIGKRTSGSGFSGTYVDVPKGLASKSGPFGAALIGSKRELILKQIGAERTTRLAPEYALDWNVFENEIAKRLDKHVVGYAFALAHNGGIIRQHAWGSRQLKIDGANLPFTTSTKSGTASAAKLVSATAIVKALHDRGLTVETHIGPFLPSCIKKGPGVAGLTFRAILSHRSGLPGGRNSGTEGSCDGRDPYQCLLDILAEGRTQSTDKDYNNKAFDLLRFLVPLVSDTAGAKAQFELFDCKNTAGVLNRKISERYARYVLDEVLRPVGSDASWYPSGDFSLNYACDAATTNGACSPDHRGEAMTTEYILRTGSGKTAMSALDYIRFLSALDRGLIVPKNLVETMKGMPGDRLGFDTAYPGRAGDYHWKNGGCPSLEHGSWGRGCNTLAMVFPGDIQAYVTINSKSNTYSPKLDNLVAAAFDKALK